MVVKNLIFSVNFFVHRIKRLIIPVYLFLTAYFIIVAILKYMAGIDVGVTSKHIIGSYLLQDGIGYVWIIRVFLLVGLLTPFLLYIEQKLKNNIVFFALYIIVLLLLEGLISNHIGTESLFIRDYFYYAIGYSLLFIMGLRIKRLPYKGVIVALLMCLIICIIQFAKHGLFINNYKYPPQFIYIVYGLTMSILSYLVIPKLRFLEKCTWCQFIGMNTIWIYLYHIPLIQFTELFLPLSWWSRYLIVYTISAGICLVQVKCVDYVSLRYKKFSVYKYLKG